MIDLARPGMLALLLVLVPVVWAWRRSRQGLPPGRARASLAVRLAMLLALVLALAGLRWTAPADRLAVVFLLDRSRSMAPEALEWEAEYLQAARRAMGPRDEYGLVAFGGDAVVERSVRPRAEDDPTAVTSVVDAEATDLAAALRLAQATFPADASRRIVVLSDGRATAGDALTEARLAAASGTSVWTATAPASESPEVLVESVEAPRQPPVNEPFDVRVTVTAERAGKALLTLTRNDGEVGRREVDLRPGPNVFLVPQRLREGGAFRYEARVEAPADRQAANNRAGTVAVARGPSRVLFVTGEGEPPGPLPDLLRRQGLEVRVVGTGALPRSPAEYAGYSAVLFSDVSALQVPETQMRWLQSLVQDSGLGFAMLGGPDSFGAGGWFRTPIEEVLPVDMDIRKSRRGAVLGLVLVLDKSGSMGEAEGSRNRLQLAVEAGIAAASLLTEDDEVGAVAFDSATRWVLPLRHYANPGQAATELATLRPGGGTDMYPGLNAAVQALAPRDLPLKHVIVLSDGRTEPGDFDSLAAAARKARITLTTVAVGGDADLNFLRDLAVKTGGRSYLAHDAALLPRIFTRETVLAARAAFAEKPFQAARGAGHSVLRGVEVAGAPALLGNNLSTLRPPPAVGVLTGPEGDPLLAVGRAGLGRTAAWTSDAGRRWARSWAAWPGFAPLMAQTVRWIASDGRDAGLDVRVEDGRVIVETPALDDVLALQGRALGPDGRVRDLELTQTGPGRYEAPFAPGQPGAWLVQVADAETGRAAVAPWTLPYSPELARLGSDPAFLARVAAAGAGEAEASPTRVFTPPAVPARVAREAWPTLLALALLLLPLDVALRRVFLPEGWWRRRPRETTAPAADPTLQALLRRKATTRADGAAAPPGNAPAPAAAPRARRLQPEEAPAAPATPPAPPDPAPPAPSAPPAPAAPAGDEDAPGSTLERLRRARDRARGRD